MYLYNHSSCSHPSLEVLVYLFLSLKGWQLSILWSVLWRFHSMYHCCHSLSLIAIYCHSMSLVVWLVVTLCHSLYHSLSLVVICCHSLYYSLSLVVIRCHSLSLDVPLVCLFINDNIRVFHNLIFLFFLCYFTSNLFSCFTLWNQLHQNLDNNLVRDSLCFIYFDVIIHQWLKKCSS